MRFLLCIILLNIPFTLIASSTYEKALTAYNNKLMDDAYIYLKTVLQTDPDDLAGKVLMGKVLMHKQYFSGGITLLYEAQSEGADINLFISDLGNALMLMKNYTDVIELGRDKSLNKENRLTWYLLSATAYHKLKNNEQARKYYNNALDLSPKSDRALASFAAFELSQKNYILAQNLITRALELYPEQSRIWNLKGSFLQSKKLYPQALLAYEKAYSLNNNDPIVQRSLANSYTHAGRFDEALLLVDKVLLTTPEDGMAKLLQSQLLSNTAKLDEAKEVLNDISLKLSLYSNEHKNENSTLKYIAGTAAYLQNDIELAQKELLAYLHDQPEDLAAINMLVDIYNRQNQKDEVLALLESKEKLIMKNLALASKLINLYLTNRKIYKAEKLLKELEKEHGEKLTYILAKVSYLTKLERYSDAITLMNKHQPQQFSSEFLLTKGLVYRADHKLEQANDIANRLLAEFPLNSNFLTFKGVILLQEQQWAEAITIFEQLLINKPEDFNSQFNIATAKAALKQYIEAKTIVNKLLETQGEFIPLRMLSAKINRDTQNPQLALDTLIDITKSNSTNAAASYLLIDIYIQLGDFEAALVESERLTRLVFLNPKYIKQKIIIHLALNQHQEANKQIRLLEGLVKGPVEIYQVSQLYNKTGDISAEKLSLERAAGLDPKSLIIKLALVNVDIVLKEHKLADKTLKSVEKKYPNNANVQLVRGQLFAAKNELTQAKNCYKKALKLDNNFNQALVNWYQLTLQGVGKKDFTKTTKKILMNKPNNHLMRRLLADHLLTIGELEQAKKQYLILKDISTLPNRASVYNNLANITLKSNPTLAENYILKAISLGGSSASMVDTYGWIKSLQGSYVEGLTLLRRAHAMNSNDPAINYHLGYTLHKLQRNQEAKKELMLALSTELNFYERDEAEKLLSSF